jgi:aryl-alcohol dehydrogenase-like predicted oxidoreductase
MSWRLWARIIGAGTSPSRDPMGMRDVGTKTSPPAFVAHLGTIPCHKRWTTLHNCRSLWKNHSQKHPMNRRDFLKSVAVACTVGGQVRLIAADSSPSTPNPTSKMPRRILGKTGVEVSDLGITYFDTAPSYNNGQSETNYGQVLARRRKEVFLATKVESRAYDAAMRGIEESLKRLRTDHLDLIQIHGISANEDLPAWDKPDGVLVALRKLRDQKVTRFIGLTGHDSAPKLRQAIEMYEFDTILTTLNPVSRRQPFREELLPVANQKKMGVIAMKVMGGGNGCLVTGNPFQQVLRPYHDQTQHQVNAPLLLRYTLGLPVSVAVVGVASIEQLKANIAVLKAQTPMTLAERRDLETAMAAV